MKVLLLMLGSGLFSGSMSVPLVEEAQRHIDRRLKRSSDVNELNSKLNAIIVERDQLKAEVEALHEEIKALKSRPSQKRKTT